MQADAVVVAGSVAVVPIGNEYEHDVAEAALDDDADDELVVDEAEEAFDKADVYG